MATQNGYPGFASNWWTEVLQEMEPAQYYSSPAGRAFGGGSPRKRRYFSNAYEDIFKEYLGAAGTAMRGGQEPASFMDFLETNPWTARYAALPQTARGVTGLAANPRTRFLYNF
jgi:hypothetical protein